MLTQGDVWLNVSDRRSPEMATNLAIDDKLLQEALLISGLKTKKDTVNHALKEFVNRRKQLEIISLFGKFEPDADYDYKKAREH